MNPSIIAYAIFYASLAIFSIPFLSDLKVKTDIVSLLPEGGVFETLRVMNKLPSLNRITVAISFNQPIDEIEDALKTVDSLAESIGKIDGVDSSYAGIAVEEKEELFNLLFQRRFMLAPFDQALLPQQLALAKIKMTLPGNDAFTASFTRDPIGLTSVIINRLNAGSGSFSTLYNDHFVSADKRHVFIFATPAFSPSNVEKGAAVSKSIRTLFSNVKNHFPAGTEFALTGGVVIASDSAKILKSDIQLAFVVTVIGLAILFIGAFGNLRIPLLFIPPVVIGSVAGGMGVYLFIGEIHGLTLGFGIALVGISVDYLIHIIVSAGLKKNYKDVLNDIFPSIALGFVSTILAMSALSFSEIPLIKEIATFGLFGLAAAFAVSVTLCPMLGDKLKAFPKINLGLLLPKKRTRPWQFAGFLIASLVFLILAMGQSYDGDLRNLKSSSPEVEKDFRKIGKLLNEKGKRSFILTSSASLDESLYECEQLLKELAKNEIRNQSPCSILPSVKTQTKNLQSFKKLDPDKLREMLDSSGFNTDAFLPFFNDLTSALAGDIAPLQIADIKDSILKQTIKGMHVNHNGKVYLLTSVLGDGQKGLRKIIATSGPAHTIFNFDEVSEKLEQIIRTELPVLVALSLSLILFLLYFYFRSIRLALLALAPPLISTIWLVGSLSIFGYEFNIIALCCVVFQLGIGLDYAIYVIRSQFIKANMMTSYIAIRLSSLTTIISFCALLLSSSVPLFIVGLTICSGIIAAALSSRLLGGLLSES